MNRDIQPVQTGMVECSGRQNLACEALKAPYKLVFVHQGRLGLDRQDEWIELESGDVLLMQEQVRSRAAIAYPPDLVYFWLLFESASPLAADLWPDRTQVSRGRRVADLFHLLLEDQESGVSMDLSRPLVKALLTEIYDHSSPNESVASTELRHALRVETFIHSNFRKPISTQDIAEALGINADYLGRSFRKARGYTLVDAIQRTRLREARLQLVEGNDTIDRIACACGFSDAGYFRRVFRKIEGVSPKEFRAQSQD
ncbi:MAG: helix-turn-helix transcriptional regulator [Verrucomicrobiota bacterium]